MNDETSKTDVCTYITHVGNVDFERSQHPNVEICHYFFEFKIKLKYFI